MRLMINFLILSLLVSVACHHQTESNRLAVAPTPVASAMAIEPPPQSKIRAAKIVQIERPEGLASRELRLSVVTFNNTMQADESVTVVPLGVNLPSLTARIVKATAGENPCSDALPKVYDVELAPLSDDAWLRLPTPFTDRRFSENAPFDVCLIYPAVPSAKALSLGSLEARRLPTRVRLQNVITAIDLNNDENADLIVTEYCCDKPHLNRHQCDLTCTSVFQRDARGSWQLVEKQTPC